MTAFVAHHRKISTEADVAIVDWLASSKAP